MVLGGTADVLGETGVLLHPLIGSEEARVVPLYRSKVPQKAKDVLFDPVVLLIDNVNVLVTVLPGVHELHGSPPVNLASTNCKSLEVHLFASGRLTCANAAEELK